MITIGIADAMVSKTRVVDHLQNIYKGAGAKVEVVLQSDSGFYYKNKQVSFRKYCRLLKEQYTDILIIMLTRDGILNERYKMFPLDIMIVTSEALKGRRGNNLRLYEHKITHSIRENSHAIVPVGFENKKILNNSASQLITYGVGRNAMVSASSVDVDVQGHHILQCCIKNNIETFQGNTIGEQEFSIKIAQKDVDLALVGVATLLLYGIDCKNI